MSAQGKQIALEVLEAVKAQMGERAFAEMADAWLAEADQQDRTARTAREVVRQPATVTMSSSRGTCSCESMPRADGRGATLTNCACEPRAASEPRPKEEPVTPVLNTRSAIEAEVARRAEQHRQQFRDLTPEQAEAHVWASEPELYARYCDLPAELPTAPRQATEAPTGIMPTQDELRADYLAFAERCQRAAGGR